MHPKHFQKCCRLCLGTSKKQLEIFAIPELSKMLQRLYKLEISPRDKCSTRICVDCYYEAKVSCNWLRVHRKLRQQIETNQKILEKQLQVTEPIEKVFGISWKTNKQQHQIRRDLLNWDQRIASTTENDPAKCGICSSVFPDARSLRHHTLNVHKIGLGQPSNPVPERQPVKRVNRSRSTRAMEDYPVVAEPTGRITRRSKSIASPVELLQPIGQPPACRTRSKSQDVRKADKSTKAVYRYLCDICGHGCTSKYRAVQHQKREHTVSNSITQLQGSNPQSEVNCTAGFVNNIRDENGSG